MSKPTILTAYEHLRGLKDHALTAREVGMLLDEIGALQAERDRLGAAILDIDAHANVIGSDEDGFNSGGYIVSLGAIHRALGLLGRTGIKQREHAVSIELAHGDGCDGCQQMKQVVFDAFESEGVRKFKESRTYG